MRRWCRNYLIRALAVALLLFGSPHLQAEPRIDIQPLIAGLNRPVAVTNAGDGSQRIFITQKGGRVLILKYGQQVTEPFLDIGAKVSNGSEQGLFSIAFHPRYASNGYFFVNYTDIFGDTVVARYQVSSDPDRAEEQSETVLLTIPQPYSNHNGGQLQFGPDGYLYIGMGDGGGGGDPDNNAQTFSNLLGKLLRVDVDGAPPYAIPVDNPFVQAPDIPDEIWAYGLRNPWRFSFDRATGDLYIGDVGQASWEEINFQPAGSNGGENYGWRRMEGTHCFNPPAACQDGGLVLPILEYVHGVGCSITGGYRHRGSQQLGLNGIYFYGDYCSGLIWAAEQAESGEWNSRVIADTDYIVSAFGEDESGEILFSHYDAVDGAIFGLYDDRIGDMPGLTQRKVRLDNPVRLVINVTNTIGADAGAMTGEWLLTLGLFDGQATGLFFVTPGGLVPVGSVADPFTAVFNFDHPTTGYEPLAMLTFAEAGLKPGDMLAYAYAYSLSDFNALAVENIVVVTVVP